VLTLPERLFAMRKPRLHHTSPKWRKAKFEPLEDRRLLSIGVSPYFGQEAEADKQDLDWGDAPDGPAPHNYRTLAGNDGANHVIGGPWLGDGGDVPDAEADGRPHPTAMGDDIVGDDEDGVEIPLLLEGQETEITVEVNGGGGRLAAWIDFNGNGTWDHPDEQIYDGLLPDGVHAIGVTPPAGSSGETFGRFRISTQDGPLLPWGAAEDGEVEDHAVTIDALRDWGDVPEIPGGFGYPTLKRNNGANHVIVPDFYLGSQIDAEPDGQPDPAAKGDDNHNVNDEDGVMFPPLSLGQPARLEVWASAAGRLDGWIDFDDDGSWEQFGDRVFWSTPVQAGMNALNIWVPATAARGASTFARFRFSSQGNLSFDGPADDGEVEDYEVFIEGYDYGDAPDDPDLGGYPTLEEHGGASHRIRPDVHLGAKIDSELDGQPDPDALGDDNDGQNGEDGDDEDGVTFTSDLVAGRNATLSVTASVGGYLNAWIDFNGNQDFNDVGEKIFASDYLVPGGNERMFPVPLDAVVDRPTFARFRFSKEQDDLPVNGPARDGEVEDYKVTIVPPYPTDWGDAPDAVLAPGYPTLALHDGARHKIVDDFYLGLGPADPELDGMPNPIALGDDLTANDDEDGVLFLSPLIPGQEASVRVIVAIPDGKAARLDAWIDFGGDGSWDEPGDQIFASRLLPVSGPNVLDFVVPPTATPGIDTFARFRLSHEGGLDPGGLLPDGELPAGEVEDYLVGMAPMDFGDAPEAMGEGGYPTLLIDDGARHVISPDLYLGNWIDMESDGQPDADASGDDLAGFGDESGVWFDTALTPGEEAQITVYASAAGLLHGWIDFDGDGAWTEAGEQIFRNTVVAAGPNVLTFDVPADAILEPTFARFRFSSEGNLAPTGMAPDGEVEDYRVLIRPAKWEQRPDPAFPENVLLGWNEYSVHNDRQIAADDWFRDSDEPITELIWWGSFLNYCDVDAAPVLPHSFHVAVWDDVPAGVDQGWSHPGEVIWETNLGRNDFTWECVGWDFDPRPFQEPAALDPREGSYEAAFRFEASLPEPLGQDVGGDGICWVSIAANYATAEVGDHPFGWKTRPRDPNSLVPDDAVRIWSSTRARFGDTFDDGEPIRWPAPGQSWDLAFQFLTDPAADPVWSQPPEPFVPLNAYHGWDEPSVYGDEQIVADDWLCDTDQPVTDVHWWGSLLDWSKPQLPEEERPDAFHFAIWTDVPADAADEDSFSHPGRLLWESYAADYEVEFAGWDFDPRDETAAPEATFYFEYELPESEYFWQEAGENIYWLSISAVYDGDAELSHPWGWKTRLRDPDSQAPDDAVRVFQPSDPALRPPGLTIAEASRFPVEGGAYASQNATGFADLEVEMLGLSLVGRAPINTVPLPPVGNTYTLDAFFDVFTTLDVPGQAHEGYSFFDVPIMLSITNLSPARSGPLCDYEIEILSMQLQGGPLPAGLQIRAGRSLSGTALGHFQANRNSDGYSIDSFFDVWTDVSVDAGQTWTAADNSLHLPFSLHRVTSGWLGNTGTFPLREGAYRSAGGTGFGTTPVEIAGLNLFATASEDASPLPPQGEGSQIDSFFDVFVEIDLDKSDDSTEPKWHTLDGLLFQVDFRNISPEADGPIQRYAAEITTFELKGGPSPGLIIRKDPNRRSLGSHVVETGPDGTTVDSFFDVWLELSTDDGQTWTAADVPVHLPFSMRRTVDTDEFPLEGSIYQSQNGTGFGEAASLRIVDLSLAAASPVSAVTLPAPGDGFEIQSSFHLYAEIDVDKAGGQTKPHYTTIDATFRFDNTSLASDDPIQQFDAELVELTGGPIGAIMLREDPDRKSPGRHTVETLASGRYVVDSFFDVWVEVSVDGGQTWAPAEEPIRLSLSMIRDAYVQGEPISWPTPDDSWDMSFVLTTRDVPRLDWGDAPDAEAPTVYPTLAVNDGARHRIGGPWLGDDDNVPDPEMDGRPHAYALGDDQAGWYDDEDGVVIPPLVPDQPVPVTVQVSGGGGVLQVWIDFDGDHTWQPSEEVYDDYLPDGTYTLDVTAPSGLIFGPTFARFRISTQGGLDPTGPAADGEVEDHEVMIVPRPVADLGDAPDSTNHCPATSMTAYPPGTAANFPTVYRSGAAPAPYGPIHWEPEAVAFLGSTVTREDEADIGPDADGVNNLDPAGDRPDRDGGDDAVQLPLTLVQCGWNTLDYTVTMASASAVGFFVNVWFDWNLDGDWDDVLEDPAGRSVPEWAVQNHQPTLPGPGTSTFTTPQFLAWLDTDAADPATWMRITLAERPWNPMAAAPGYGGSGPADGYQLGETEDYYAPIDLQELDFGDAPDDAAAPGYPTRQGNNGARHLIGGPWLGDEQDAPDVDPDGQPEPNALGDDHDNRDDENGVSIPELIPGREAEVSLTVNGGGFVDAWIDFDADGVWQASDRIHGDFLPHGPQTITVNVPDTSTLGPTFARFRISSQGNLDPDGPADDGEVEDYQVVIGAPQSDLGDAPDSSNSYGSAPMSAYPEVPANFPTVYEAGSPPYGPIHRQPEDFAFLGAAVTREEDADIGPDDEMVNNIDPPNDKANLDGADDGVLFPLTLENCQANTFQYMVTVVDSQLAPLYVNVWFDWNADGDWNDTIACPDDMSAPEWAVQDHLLPSVEPGDHTFTTPSFPAWISPDVPAVWMRITLSEQPWETIGADGGAGPPEGYAYGETEDYLVSTGAAVVGRHIFYNESAWDGNDALANENDDLAIAPDPAGAADPHLGKTALLPCQTATLKNYTSYARGINGIMVDIAGLAGEPTEADFVFKVGNDGNPDAWQLAPFPSDLTLRSGDGVDGSDRVTIIWPSNAIQQQWLQVTVLATANTGLSENDVFYFGNAIGETGNAATDARVNAIDMLLARNNPHGLVDPASRDDAYDFNRDKRVDATDMLLARSHQTHLLSALKLITAPCLSEGNEAKSRRSVPDRWDWVAELDVRNSEHWSSKKDQARRKLFDELLAEYGR